MVCIFSFLYHVKKCLVLAFFLLITGLSLYAQNFREARIFVQPVDGTGMIGDNAFFYKQLTYEVVLQYYTLARTRHASDFMLRGTIAPYTGEEQFLVDYPPEESEIANTGPVPTRPIPRIRNTFGRREFFSWETNGEIVFFDTSIEDSGSGTEPESFHIEEGIGDDDSAGESVFTLELINSISGEVIAKQYIIYRFTDAAVGDLISIIVYNMLTGIPDIEADADWSNNWLFANIDAIWSPRVYAVPDPYTSWVNFGIGVSLEYHFLDFMSVGLGVQLVQDCIVIPDEDYGVEYRDLLLEIPLALKFVFRPSMFTLEPYGGISYNHSLMGTTNPSFLSWFAGIQAGMKVGPGMIVIDPCFSMDFFNSQIVENSIEYQRYLFQISLGYKFGFLPKRGSFRNY
jgi:hypothetical protein